MSVILAIETSTQACSCALNRHGSVSEHFDIIPRQHAGQLLPMIRNLLAEHDLVFADLDAVAYGQGPGSFTGLRIAAGVTQGIAFGAGLPVIPVSTLASLAWQVKGSAPEEMVFCTLDARIDEVYWGFYSVTGDGVELVGEEGLCKPEALPAALPGAPAGLAAAGSGLDYLERMPAIYHEKIGFCMPDLHPRAAPIAHLAAGLLAQGRVQTPEEVSPVYLRDKVTQV